MSQWATVQHRLTFVAQQKAGKVVVQPTNSISFLNNLQHPEWPIQESVWQDKQFNSRWSPKLNSASLAVKLNCIRIGCFSVCWGGGKEGGAGVEEGEFPFPHASFDLLLLKLSSHEALLPDHPTSFKSITCQFCFFIYFFLFIPLHFSFWSFCCFCCCCCCFISCFLLPIQRIFANFSPGAGRRVGGWFFGLKGRGGRD